MSIFIVAGSTYLLALAVMYLINPRYGPLTQFSEFRI